MGIYIGNTSTRETTKTVDHGAALNQLLHDMASPISALGVCLHRLQAGVQSDSLDLLKLTFERLSTMTARKPVVKSREKFDVVDIIQKIIVEKEMGGADPVDFDLASPESCLAVVNKSEFGRIVSNLINNSIEANCSQISIRITELQPCIHVEIADDGDGFDSKIKHFIGVPGMSVGSKLNGNGLGLSHAIQTIRSWGGDVEVNSKRGEGTTITLALKKA